MEASDTLRERLLILCRATPEESKRYTRTVCVAGLTDHGELRRIYPVPFRQFVPAGGIPFRKKQWIEADLGPPESKQDRRRESRRINLRTVSAGPRVEDSEVRLAITPHLAQNIASLEANGATLGILKPDIVHYDVTITSTDLTTGQMTLDPGDTGTRVGLAKLGQESHYQFNCPKRTGCVCEKHPHDMICLDWEVNELYRNIIKSGTTAPAQIEYKMRQRLFYWMRNDRETYFMLGTHHLWRSWMVVSIIHLRPEDTA